MNPTHLELKSVKDLFFIGEGNEHMVLGLRDTENVVRFRKFPILESISREDLMLRVQNDVGFINDVARPLAGTLLVDEAHLVSVDPLLLEKVMERIKPLRDGKRLWKEVNKFGIGILSPNVAAYFIERSQKDMKPYPKIFNFHMTDDVITISKVAFLSKSEPINTTSGRAAGNAAEDEISLKRSTESACAEQHPSESHEQTTLRVEPPGGVITELIVEDKQSGLNTQMDSSKPQAQDSENLNLICIELKPKQGFAELGPNNHSLCRFCLKQFIKVERNIEPIHSAYCPRDLFSGDPSLMEKAIQNLYSCPQNNLKIFSNGRRVMDLHPFRYLIRLIIQVLTYEMPVAVEEDSKLDSKIDSYPPSGSCLSADVASRSSEAYNGTIETSENPSSILPQGSQLSSSSCLGRLLYLQSLGNIPEICAVELYRKLNHRTGSIELSNDLLTNFEYLKQKKTEYRLDKLKETEGENDKSEKPESSQGKNSKLETYVIVQLLQESLVTIIAKDASLMILIEGPYNKSLPMESPIILSPFWVESILESGKWYKCQISLVDISQKIPDRIFDHEHALETLENILIKLKADKKEPPCCQTRKRKRE